MNDSSTDLNLMITYFDQVIDGCVYELFFPDKFEKKGWSIINNIIDLENIVDLTSNNDKLKIIKYKFDKLYDSKNTIRNIIFYLDSIEEIRKIEKRYADYRN